MYQYKNLHQILCTWRIVFVLLLLMSETMEISCTILCFHATASHAGFLGNRHKLNPSVWTVWYVEKTLTIRLNLKRSTHMYQQNKTMVINWNHEHILNHDNIVNPTGIDECSLWEEQKKVTLQDCCSSDEETSDEAHYVPPFMYTQCHWGPHLTSCGNVGRFCYRSMCTTTISWHS